MQNNLLRCNILPRNTYLVFLEEGDCPVYLPTGSTRNIAATTAGISPDEKNVDVASETQEVSCVEEGCYPTTLDNLDPKCFPMHRPQYRP